MKRLLVCVALAACGGGAAPAPSNVAPPREAPITPAPSIARAPEDGPFTWTGLPAVTADGSNVVIANAREDGARGEPNLTLLVKDRADALVEEQVVLAPDGEQPWRANLDTTNAYLARVHQERELVPLAPIAGSGLEVAWDEGRLIVRSGDAAVVEREHRDWTIAPTPQCENPSFLADAWTDAARKLVLVKISYRGTDTCWEPDSSYHVVAW
jgi:hypothetical protein